MSLCCDSRIFRSIQVFTETQVLLRDVYYPSAARKCSEEKENTP